MSESPQERAPLGALAEPEVPQHTLDPDRAAELAGAGDGADDTPVEESLTYQLAVEDGAPLPAGEQDPGAGEAAPQFREPGDG